MSPGLSLICKISSRNGAVNPEEAYPYRRTSRAGTHNEGLNLSRIGWLVTVREWAAQVKPDALAGLPLRADTVRSDCLMERCRCART
jgi:hypothetical protein